MEPPTTGTVAYQVTYAAKESVVLTDDLVVGGAYHHRGVIRNQLVSKIADDPKGDPKDRDLMKAIQVATNYGAKAAVDNPPPPQKIRHQKHGALMSKSGTCLPQLPSTQRALTRPLPPQFVILGTNACFTQPYHVCCQLARSLVSTLDFCRIATCYGNKEAPAIYELIRQ